MTQLLAVADDRFRKRPLLYQNFRAHVEIFAKKNRLTSCCVFFSRDRRVPDQFSESFDQIVVADSRFLSTDVDLAELFEQVLVEKKIVTIISLYHPKLEIFLHNRFRDQLRMIPDVCDIRLEDGEQQLYLPRLSFRYYLKRPIEPGMMIFVRACVDPTEPPSLLSAQITNFPFRFPKDPTAVRAHAVETNYSIIAGSGVADKKHFTRYIVSIGEKMKGAALSTESLHGRDESISWNSCAELFTSIETDFSVIVGEEGNYDLLEKILCQKFVVFIEELPISPLLLVADVVIVDNCNQFLENYNKKLRKVSFRAKKINKKK
ncbi:MAG: hypothetical protein PF637_13940 [Spirochaetes bacterium]|jgi:hypothetical protein|nr:hypothetical protein [Spirochaetota bacterium]